MDLSHINYSDNVLSPKELKQLQKYIMDNLDTRGKENGNGMYKLKNGKGFPLYNFLPKDKEPSNFLEKLITKLIGQEKHIEYWIRYNDIPLWHIDSDEVVERTTTNPFLSETKEFPTQSYVFYVHILNVTGGDLQILPFNKYEEGRPTLDDNYEPKKGDKIITVKPKTNYLVTWKGNLYHRVTEQYSGERLCLVWSLWDKIPRGFKENLHWAPSEIIPWADPAYRRGMLIKPIKWPIKEDQI